MISLILFVTVILAAHFLFRQQLRFPQNRRGQAEAAPGENQHQHGRPVCRHRCVPIAPARPTLVSRPADRLYFRRRADQPVLRHPQLAKIPYGGGGKIKRIKKTRLPAGFFCVRGNPQSLGASRDVTHRFSSQLVHLRGRRSPGNGTVDLLQGRLVDVKVRQFSSALFQRTKNPHLVVPPANQLDPIPPPGRQLPAPGPTRPDPGNLKPNLRSGFLWDASI